MNGLFTNWRISHSAIVWFFYDVVLILSFHNTFIAKISPESFFVTMNTLPKLPQPITFMISKWCMFTSFEYRISSPGFIISEEYVSSIVEADGLVHLRGIGFVPSSPLLAQIPINDYTASYVSSCGKLLWRCESEIEPWSSLNLLMALQRQWQVQVRFSN